MTSEKAFYNWWQSPDEFNKEPDSKILESFKAGYESQQDTIDDLKNLNARLKKFIGKGFWECLGCKKSSQIAPVNSEYCPECKVKNQKLFKETMKKVYIPIIPFEYKSPLIRKLK